MLFFAIIYSMSISRQDIRTFTSERETGWGQRRKNDVCKRTAACFRSYPKLISHLLINGRIFLAGNSHGIYCDTIKERAYFIASNLCYQTSSSVEILAIDCVCVNFIFIPPDRRIGGILILACLSVTLSFCPKT